MERSKVIFGNEISKKQYRKACKSKAKNMKKFGDDSGASYRFAVKDNNVLSALNVKNLVLTDSEEFRPDEKSVIVGNIRMGYGHYRISIAIASAAHALGYTPYWLDMNSYEGTTATKLISSQNDLYSLGSRISQKSKLFNKIVWEPLNSEGFRQLTYNSTDQKNAELMEPLLRNIPKNIPYIATHVWPAQAAVHAGFDRVVNVIPDNWPMALHLAEGSIHTVQTPSSFLGYKMLRGMDKKRILKPMPEGDLFNVGHYVDHELVSNIDKDCGARIARMENGKPRRFLLTIGGAGAQQTLFEEIIKYLLPEIKAKRATLYVNFGDHTKVRDAMKESVPELESIGVKHYDGFEKTAREIQSGELDGLHVFCDKDIFSAVYMTNLLMRECDVLITKPGELSFYPVPKLMIHRVGGHEAWGAIRAAEVGDGTYECEKTEEVIAMIAEMIRGKEIIGSMCDNIKRANAAKVYDGAYEVVKIAVNNK